MPVKYWFKFSILTLALSASLASIILLKQGHMGQFWTSLGFQSSESRINWCDERVQSLYFYSSKAKITEESGKWLWKGDDTVMLDYLDVEKWFAKYCLLPIEPATATETTGSPIFEVKFINGERLTFHQIDENHIKLRGEIYRVPVLREALKELLAFNPKIE